MNIKDIVNRDLVNVTNCEHEPIHIPGSIQPHGFLLGISENGNVAFCSGNISEYCDMSYESILGKSFESVFGQANKKQLDDYVDSAAFVSTLPIKMALADKYYDCSIHKSEDIYIIEAEPVSQSQKAEDVYSQSAKFVSYMNATSTLRELCDLVAKGTREITGYDRVMVYRFDKEYNGEVFAESVRDDLEPFFGLRYPHTDIPVQARALYMKNLLRLIVDINYTPVPIFTLDDLPGKNLDLSVSVLRSTSPIHVEYLQNMGVGATLTISLIHRDKLWGLIACHHYSIKNLTPEIRLAAQLQGQFITSQIDVRQSNEEYDISRKTNIALEKLTALNLPPVSESFKIISIDEALLRVCNASGVSLLISGTVYKNGAAPLDNDIRNLSGWLFDYSNDGTFFTDKLVDFVPDMRQLCETVSGVLYHSLGNGNSVIWYRPETMTEVSWAGNPEKAIVRDSHGLHPRNSFNKWKQIIKFRSKPWLQPEIIAAANYAHALQKQISLLLMSREEEKYRKLSEKLEETNAELENINWISTHDLQEPLRKIQVFGSMLLSTNHENMPAKTLDYIKKMNDSAHRMQVLLIDILKYTRIKYAADAFEMIDMNTVVADILTDLNEMILEKNAVVHTDKLPVINGILFLIRQMVSNIILNSLKYSSTDRNPVIDITSLGNATHRESGSLCYGIRFSDNGIGFGGQYADSIFNIFKRLHSHADYKGSGVGLALCRKIMQTHGGTITASGIPNEGAQFTIYFPCDANAFSD